MNYNIIMKLLTEIFCSPTSVLVTSKTLYFQDINLY